MEALRIRGGNKLRGEWTVHSAKNALLPIMAASILTREDVVLSGCPQLSDIRYMGDILTKLGCKVWRSEDSLCIDPRGMSRYEMPDDLAKKIRSSIFLLGPILARCRRATVTLPGGCEIGMRPIDLHLNGLRQLGVHIHDDRGIITCDGREMRAGSVHFDYPSVGATENVMMAATMLNGRTTLNNVAREPEIVDLQRFLNRMGARVSGAGTHTIRVEGVRELHGVSYRAMPDRIVAGTLLAAAAITGGDIRLLNAPCGDMFAIFSKLREMGCDISEHGSEVRLAAPERPRALSQLQTQPHPGFPTDMQVQMLALCTAAEGTSVIVENVFENRFTHAGDLNRMGANIMVNGRTAIVQGVDTLYGAEVLSRDLRGGAALVLAGLRARGETLVEHAELIDRGYERYDAMLQALGADIQRVHMAIGEGTRE